MVRWAADHYVVSQDSFKGGKEKAIRKIHGGVIIESHEEAQKEWHGNRLNTVKLVSPFFLDYLSVNF